MFEVMFSAFKVLATGASLYFQAMFLYLAYKHPTVIENIPAKYKLAVVGFIVLFSVACLVMALYDIGLGL